MKTGGGGARAVQPARLLVRLRRPADGGAAARPRRAVRDGALLPDPRRPRALRFYATRRAASRGSRRPTGRRTAAARRADRRLRAAQERRRRLLLDAIAAAAVAAARCGGGPCGAPSQVDDLVNLLGGDATVPLLKVLGLSVDKWVTTAELLAPPRAHVGGERRRRHARVLKLLEAHGGDLPRSRRRVAAARPAVAARDRGGGAVVTELKAKRWRERLRGAGGDALRTARRHDDEAAAAVPAPRPPAEREWASFCGVGSHQGLVICRGTRRGCRR